MGQAVMMTLNDDPPPPRNTAGARGRLGQSSLDRIPLGTMNSLGCRNWQPIWSVAG
jgi:hypothetical protein